MPVLSAVFLVVATVVLTVSMWWVIRENPSERMPYLKNPRRVPGGAIALRMVGVGLAIFGAVSADLPSAWWAGVAVLLTWLPTWALHLWHNARLGVAGARAL